MSIRHRVIMINGAPGVGKSWLANQLVSEINQHSSGYARPAKRLGFNVGIMETTATIMGFDASAMSDDMWTAFKNEKLLPNYTGRDLMIAIATVGRGLSMSHWTDRFMDEVRKLDKRAMKGFLFINDSYGFEDESAALRAQEDFDLLNVYIADEDGKMQTDGELRQFPGDSRFDLSRYCTIRSETSTQAYHAVIRALRNRNW